MADKSDILAKWTIRDVPVETKRLLHKLAIERGITIAEALVLVVTAYVEQQQEERAD